MELAQLTNDYLEVVHFVFYLDKHFSLVAMAVLQSKFGICSWVLKWGPVRLESSEWNRECNPTTEPHFFKLYHACIWILFIFSPSRHYPELFLFIFNGQLTEVEVKLLELDEMPAGRKN